jgi:predicted Zn finger-like uncharacterized protein
MTLTRCPTCATTFRVTAEQLKTHNGTVRCGHCQTVFNAFDDLTESVPIALDTENTEPLTVTPATDILDLEKNTQEQDHQQPRRIAKAIWGFLAFVMLCVFIAQAIYLFRSELAREIPELRPILEDACQHLNCDIALPRKAQWLAIEASDLAPDPTHKSLLLTALIKNRASFAQALPHLELTLTDTLDQPIVRRIFAPTEYLETPLNQDTTFEANSELSLRLWLDHQVPAAGFRLYVFYP